MKLRYGHFEGDTIVSGKRTGSRASLSVLYERKAKYVVAVKISSLKPDENNRALKKMSSRLKGLKSFTLDNGVESQEDHWTTKHLEVMMENNLPVFQIDTITPAKIFEKVSYEINAFPYFHLIRRDMRPFKRVIASIQPSGLLKLTRMEVR